MANTRIKDISTAATTLNSDDFIAVDGATSGTRKMAKADLITEVSTGVSGTYLEESNNLSDVASKDTSKLNLEVPNVGGSANEVSLNGQLGTMAFQDASGVSVGQLEVTDKIDLSGAPTQQLEVYGDAPTVRVTDTSDGVGDGDSIGKLEFYGNDGSSGGVGVRAKIDTVSETAAGNQYGVAISTSTANAAPVERVRVDGAGRVGVGGSPSYELDVQAANARIAATSAAGVVNHLQADATGAWVGPLSNHDLYFKTNNSTRWTIHSSNGNLIASSGVGIDFGAVASGTGTVTPTTGGLLDDFETGTWTGTYAPQTGTFTTMTMDTDLVYTKVGNLVHVSGFIRTDDVDITGGSNGLKITGLPFTCAKPSAVSIGFAWNWGTAAPLVGYIGASGDAIWLQTRTGTTARTDGFNVSNMSTGTSADRNILYLEATYQAS